MVHVRVFSATVIGIDPVLVEVEVIIDNQGFPAFNIVGLADKSVDESKERVRAAVKCLGYDFPDRRITVNLAPAELHKRGSIFDLPIAIGVLLSSSQIKAELDGSMFVGELSLDGRIKAVSGVLPIVIFAKTKGFKSIFIPGSCSKEASIISEINIFASDSLKAVCDHLLDIKPIPKLSGEKLEDLLKEEAFFGEDISEVYGQEKAKRALEICAAGGHNLSMFGPPGSGKTMLSRSLPSILPAFTVDECLEVTKIYSIAGHLLNKEKPILTKRPFRSPHHTTSLPGLIGGGSPPAPGEVTLAHRGVLFIDEFSEMPRYLIEALRQPLEDGYISISRSLGRVVFPSRFVLIASFNPCPCGYLGDEKNKCRCTPYEILSYQKKLSGPILDRIDMFVDVKASDASDITSENKGEKSKKVRERVQRARDTQSRRFLASNLKISCNAEISPSQIKKQCPLETSEMNFLKNAMNSFKFSLRTFHRVIKVSRTIADLSDSEKIKTEHIAEALQYRIKI
ncbi:magnesium chelatase [candidate division WWE3 bacterium RIFCSPHIGHO2_01_FULL_40_23]|uniref:Magnesium chelatase n=1 Tax=candidate division WWE3 bacterium RIFCSPLOWO2_01_FULL_41_18 TaxID=1802625 RepID=A0A1F4VD59_UNCKA|nr:MAG: magnesium chelatase [candidate division WWE3 bacterium RIFCSPHIGHO2_01_FULL_40_23]OGC55074.1 MAG: magnesium chelatase [candidate division WWE3 bacterium RIFCSPLOWO2_01_FULL_41_18]